MKPELIYALQSIACAGIFLLIFRLLLEGRVRPLAGRIYLLVTMTLCTIIPLLSIPVLPGRGILIPAVTELTAGSVMATSPAVVAADAPTVNFLPWIYIGGTGFAFLMFIRQLAGINAMKRVARRQREDGYIPYTSNRILSPFSFFRAIFTGERHTPEELEKIIYHERSHIRHMHSLEMVYIELLRCIMWFNPFVWLARRYLTEIHEYQADRDVLNAGYSLSDYRTLIFKQLCGFGPDLANGLNRSLTKKRFVMMTKKNPRRRSILRTAAALPATGIMLALFSFTTREPIYIAVETEAAYLPAVSPAQTLADEAVPSSYAFRDNTPHSSTEDGADESTITTHVTVITDGNVSTSGKVVFRDMPEYYPKTGTVATEDGTIINLTLVDKDHYLFSTTSENPGEINITVRTVEGNQPNVVIENRSQDPAVAEALSSGTYFYTQTTTGTSGTMESKMEISGNPPSGTVSSTYIPKDGEETERSTLRERRTRDGDTQAPQATAQPGRVSQQQVTVQRGTSTQPQAPQSRQEKNDDASVIKNDAKITVTYNYDDEEPDAVVSRTTVREEDEDDAPFFSAEIMPSFQGGDLNKFRQWVQERLKLPREMAEVSFQGMVTASFVIERDGSVSTVEVLQSPHESLSKEVVRVIGQSPKWSPGKQRSQPVRIKYILPVSFK